MWREGIPPTLLVGMQTGTIARENNMDVPQEINDTTTMWSSNPNFGCIFKENENMIPKSYLYIYWIPCSVIHNSQDMDTI